MQLLSNKENLPFYLMGFVFLMTCMNTCNSCSSNKRVSKLTSKIDSLQVAVESKPNTQRVETMIKVEGLRSSKRTLYDWNAVVRTAVRPDDRMNEYDKEIQKLEK